jgi:hypothetical protein
MDARARTDPKGATWVASVEEHLEEARRLDLASTQGRFRLGDLTEALSRELPAVADLLGRLAIDLELDRDTITESWFVATAFPARHPPSRPRLGQLRGLAVSPCSPRAGRPRRIRGWGQARLDREVSAWFAAHHHRPDQSA